jgi:hypothetical protein
MRIVFRRWSDDSIGTCARFVDVPRDADVLRVEQLQKRALPGGTWRFALRPGPRPEAEVTSPGLRASPRR